MQPTPVFLPGKSHGRRNLVGYGPWDRKELDTTEQLHFSITSWQIDGETVETVRDFIFVAPKSLQMVTAAMKLKDACSLEEKL